MTPERSSVRVVALSGRVGIAAMDPKTTQAPEWRGRASKIIGTDSQYPTDTYIPVSEIHRNGGRLATELIALWNAGLVDIQVDGVSITASRELLAYSEPDGLEHAGEVFIHTFSNWQDISGAWNEFYNTTSRLFRIVRTAAAASEQFVMVVPSDYLRAGAEGAGRKPRGIKMFYSVTAADLVVDVGMAVYQCTPPATGVAFPNAALISTSATYDTAHDTAAERRVQGNHTMTLTLAAADVSYLNDEEGIHVEVTVNDTGGGAAVFTCFGMTFQYYERANIASDSSQS